MKKIIYCIIAILIILTAIVIIFKTMHKEKNITSTKDTLNIALVVEPDTLDPTLVESVDLHSMLTNTFEGLVNIDEKGNFLPGVAEKWTNNEENTEYTFYLRKNSTWTDGTPVTANDFKYAWLRVLNPDTGSPTASYLYYIKNAENYNKGLIDESEVGIEVIDDYTLLVKLETPCSYFLSLTTLQSYLPIKKGIVEKVGEAWGQNVEQLLTNGAFTIVEWNHDTNILMKKNYNYWDSKNVILENLNFVLYTDPTVIMNAYENNELDFVEYTLTVDEMKQVDNVKFTDAVTSRIVEMNMNNEVLRNEKVRQAINIALDREEIVKLAGEGNYPSTFFIPYGFYNSVEGKDYREDSNAKNYFSSKADIEKAKELLKEAGYENGNGIPTLVYVTNTIGYNSKNAEIVKNQLEKIGINIEVRALDRKLVSSLLAKGEYDLTHMNLIVEYPDISVFLYSLRSTDISNFSHYNNPKYDELYSKIIIENDLKTKYELVHQAEDTLMNDNAVITLYCQKLNYIAKDNLTGYSHDLEGCLNLKKAYFKD